MDKMRTGMTSRVRRLDDGGASGGGRYATALFFSATASVGTMLRYAFGMGPARADSMKAKPNLAIGDEIEFRQAEGYILSGRVIRVFDDHALVRIMSTYAEWSEIVPFENIRTIRPFPRGRTARPNLVTEG